MAVISSSDISAETRKAEFTRHDRDLDALAASYNKGKKNFGAKQYVRKIVAIKKPLVARKYVYFGLNLVISRPYGMEKLVDPILELPPLGTRSCSI